MTLALITCDTFYNMYFLFCPILSYPILQQTLPSHSITSLPILFHFTKRMLFITHSFDFTTLYHGLKSTVDTVFSTCFASLSFTFQYVFFSNFSLSPILSQMLKKITHCSLTQKKKLLFPEVYYLLPSQCFPRR